MKTIITGICASFLCTAAIAEPTSQTSIINFTSPESLMITSLGANTTDGLQAQRSAFNNHFFIYSYLNTYTHGIVYVTLTTDDGHSCTIDIDENPTTHQLTVYKDVNSAKVQFISMKETAPDQYSITLS
ncbi:MAG: hypothetical protein K0U29_08250 [Gammaproteobacteria bacterium]|nr:hypothetical protein [Gammaproteobacteria bacterium]MCH9744902.1 hypothetical protein [Gammaproteobacteria bacterium]